MASSLKSGKTVAGGYIGTYMGAIPIEGVCGKVGRFSFVRADLSLCGTKKRTNPIISIEYIRVLNSWIQQLPPNKRFKNFKHKSSFFILVIFISCRFLCFLWKQDKTNFPVIWLSCREIWKPGKFNRQFS